jgi:restriction endonuclease S subunit
MEIKINKNTWKKVRLGDVATEYSKRINNPSESKFERFVGSNSINQWDFRVRSWESTRSVSSAMKLFETGDYLLVRRSLYASDFRERAPRAHFDGVCSGDILTIRENPEFLHNGFLIGILNCTALWKFVVANASGSITRRIKWKDLANFEFMLPPKKEQSEIADLMWSIDCVIHENISLENYSRILKESLFEHFILDQMSDSTKVTIAEIASSVPNACVGGPFGSDLSGKHYVELPGVPVIRGANLSKGIFKFVEEGFVFVSEEKADKLKRNMAFRGDVIVTQRGTMGQVGIIPMNSRHDRYVVSQSQMKLTVDEAKALPEFIYYYLLSNRAQRDLKSATISTGIPHINLGIFKSLKIILPSIQMQNQIVQKLSILEKCLNELHKHISNSKHLKKILINKVF